MAGDLLCRVILFRVYTCVYMAGDLLCRVTLFGVYTCMLVINNIFIAVCCIAACIYMVRYFIIRDKYIYTY